MSASFIDYTALEQGIVHLEPFPYMVLPQFIKKEHLDALVSAFPEISHRGSIPVSAVEALPLFRGLVDELQGTKLRELIAEKFKITLSRKPTMLTLRGNTTERDGAIHTDSRSKLMTLLLYMNSHWDASEGQLRLLKNKHSLEDFVEEISPHAGSCVIFQVTKNCWHGHKPFVGKRQSMQLNYLANDAALAKHLNHHRLTAWLKKLFPKIFKQNENY